MGEGPWMKTIFLVPVVLLAACAALEPTEQFDTGSATVVISRLSPQPGTVVTVDTVIEATLRYEIRNYVDKRDLYYIFAQFIATDPKRTMATIGVKQTADTLVNITSLSGTVALKIPLKDVWDQPSLKRPMTLYFFLNERTAPNKSVVIGAVGPIEFQ
jgi:hypothetical protein